MGGLRCEDSSAETMATYLLSNLFIKGKENKNRQDKEAWQYFR